MDFKSKKNIFSFFWLLITTWAVLATSMPVESLNSGTYRVKSDCVVPVLELVVTVDAGQVTAPGGVSYTDFGFPQPTVVVGETNEGPVGLVTRSCRDTYGDKNEKVYVFSCFDNGAFSCTILIRR